jgi:hypothetical protein
MEPAPHADPVGIVEVADRLGLARQTLTNLRYASLHGTGGTHPFPEPRWTIGGKTPAWDWQLDIVPWATATGRIGCGRRSVPDWRHGIKDWPYSSELCRHGVAFGGHGAPLAFATETDRCAECATAAVAAVNTGESPGVS